MVPCFEVIDMPTAASVSPADFDDAIQRYIRGEGRIMDIAKSIGVGVDRFHREMLARDIPIRRRSEAQSLRYARDAGTEWRKRFNESARKARTEWINSEANKKRMSELGKSYGPRNKGRIASEQSVNNRAIAHERHMLKVSPQAIVFNQWLIDRGLQTTMEKACGRYNIDIAIGSVAVEIHPYSFMPLGRMRTREHERTRYICDRGWLLCYVWISARGYILAESAADYIAALVKEAEANPALIGEYRVIRGTSEFVTGGRFNGD